MNLTPNANAGHWTAKYVGRPWALDFTCWDLCTAVQRERFGRGLPAVDRPMAELDSDAIRALVEQSAWHRAETPVEGDLLVMRGPDGLHIGVVVLLGVRPKLLHNVGGVEKDGAATHGNVRLDLLAELGRMGYGRFELWGPPLT
jgi:hypothetical protein